MGWRKRRTPLRVQQSKDELNKASDQANKDIKRLNKLLVGNGVALKMYLITHGDKHA